ncbi:hypothetical protein ACFOJ6_14735 [Gordonia humi]|uniref:hypothetical protein n=1 Tax=Gordonia humi TaxID=686429 RepID=UPI00361F2DD2
MFSVSARTWREDRRAAREHLAPPLSTTLREALNSGPPTGVDSVAWEPLRRATVDVDGDAATALVVARVSVTPSGAPEQVVERTVQASLVRVDGRWLLAGLDELR